MRASERGLYTGSRSMDCDPAFFYLMICDIINLQNKESKYKRSLNRNFFISRNEVYNASRSDNNL